MSRNFYVRTYVKFTFANRIEAMHEWSLVREEREGFIAALPSALKHVRAWPEANLHIKIL